MSSKRTAREQAQQRAAEMRAKQARKEKQQKQIIAAIVGLVVVAIAFAIVLAVSSRKDDKKSADGGDVVKQVTSVPASAFDAAGVPENAAQGGSVPKKLADGKVLTKDGKPRVVYVGALYCPYCGTHRWATIAALSRFGTFEGLKEHRSGEGSIPTFSFKDARFTSQYLVFDAYETKDDNNQEITKLPDDIAAAFDKFNAPPYEQGKGSIPWTFYGTHAQSGGPGPTEQLAAESGDDAWSKVAKEMQTGQGVFGKGIDAEANMMTAQICQLTKGQPGTVCSSKGVTEASKLLQK